MSNLKYSPKLDTRNPRSSKVRSPIIRRLWWKEGKQVQQTSNKTSSTNQARTQSCPWCRRRIFACRISRTRRWLRRTLQTTSSSRQRIGPTNGRSRIRLGNKMLNRPRSTGWTSRRRRLLDAGQFLGTRHSKLWWSPLNLQTKTHNCNWGRCIFIKLTYRTVQAKCEQHHEENERPKYAAGHRGNRSWVHHKNQSRTFSGHFLDRSSSGVCHVAQNWKYYESSYEARRGVDYAGQQGISEKNYWSFDVNLIWVRTCRHCCGTCYMKHRLKVLQILAQVKRRLALLHQPTPTISVYRHFKLCFGMFYLRWSNGTEVWTEVVLDSLSWARQSYTPD